MHYCDDLRRMLRDFLKSSRPDSGHRTGERALFLPSTRLALAALALFATAIPRAQALTFSYPTIPGIDATNGEDFLKIAANGTIFGKATDGNYQTVYFTYDGTTTNTYDQQNFTYFFAGVNSSGAVAGTSLDGGQNLFTLSGGSLNYIYTTGLARPVATGITDNGILYGNGTTTDGSNTTVGFVQNGGTTTVIQDPNATYLNVLGANNNGDAVGIYLDSNNNLNSFLEHNGIYTDITITGGASLIAYGINDQGTIVGTYQGPDNITYGYIRAADGTFTTVNAPVFSTTINLYDINNAGVIVGNYLSDTNTDVAFTLSTDAPPATDTPEPASAALLLAGLIPLAARRRRN